MEIIIVQGIITLVGIIFTGYFSTKSAMINSNARQAKTEQKFEDEINQVKSNLTSINKRLDELSETDSCCATLQKDVVNLKTENRLTMKAIKACLEGLTQLGCNHSVTDTKAELDTWLNNTAHE